MSRSRMTLEEVTDDYDIANDDQYTDVSESDSESELGDEVDEPLDETLYERLVALKDIIPPPTRARLSNAVSTGKSGLSTVALLGGKSLWAITSSLLLIGIPFMMAVEAEAQVQEEQKAMQLQAGSQDLLGGTGSPALQVAGQAGPAAAVRPPGF
ncbi:mitochondrial import receptor subunit Tom22 [Savitreella phatthalungensis]